MAHKADGDTLQNPAHTLRTLAESLWFPAFFALGFLFCYLLPFHQPSPHHVKIAVAGPAAVQIQAALDKASQGAFDIQQVTTTAAARQAVLDRDVVAGFSPVPGHSVLYVAKAEGYLLESVVNQAITPIAAKSGGALTVTDLAPTTNGDPMGTGLFYLVLAWTIPSYIVVMMLLRAVTLSRRAKLLTLVGWGAAVSVLGYLVGLALDVIPSDPVTIPLAFLLTQGVALTAFGLVPFFKQFVPGVAVGLFVLLSMPSSGGAVPVQLVPGFFRALHPVMPMGNLIEALRGVFYFDGAGVAGPVLVLCAWVLFGVVLIAGRAWWQRRQAVPTDVAEPPVEDPTIEIPRPTALVPHPHHFGEPVPMVRGTVRTGGGKRVAGAVVTVTDGRGGQLVRAVADEHGVYGVTGLPEQFVDVVVSAPGLHSAVRRIPVREGISRVEDFELASRRPTVTASPGA
ncbi:carboxypeptidase regulatory-like domain-containing protein [Amycolatopsis cynarae]|uniref:Carboxypeptidase regulatory-like domain-containing protein n=1 Tax=Amycolatopsis cynarae TaxID=2995223 RepID=A0ABY7B0I8_9PSEU|nr:carboxypeptidase regulatory-like domain-containing protein [Amycolatopsis sp. HUAS 11-8]WAL65706.1 carboxypeptidase regulatory-like domain-containing protein [Amycolatopsis sp. HUAS 11-8]